MKAALYTFVTLAVAYGAAATAADLDAKIEFCNSCHGDNGVSQWDDMPSIGGLDSFTGSESLYVYQDEARPCSKSKFRQGDTSQPEMSMCEIAADLDDEQIEAIAEHYASLPFVPADQPFDADKAAAGKAIHEDACDRCHSEGGSNPEDEASILAGQWMGYLRSSFADYQSGDREQPKKMEEAVSGLSADDIEALLHFYASQQ
jgi:sulfide dehydrogenase cytochrome subunit